MAITGKFIADFTAFQTAVKQAEVALTGMETNANKVGTSLNRMVDQFSGRKLVQDAQLMAQTFEHLAEKGIGLTTAELQRMGAVGSAAIEKLKASGEKVPPEIQKIVDAANKVKPAMESAQSSTAGLLGTLQKAAATFGIAFSVGALTRFVGNVLDTASAIGDLSQQLGISAEAAQRFKYAAEQSGSSIDAVGTSIQYMNKTLGAGDNSTKALLREIGLRFEDIRSMSPEDAFVAISDSLGGMTDKAKQAEAGAKLLGRGFAELLPAMEDGIKKVGDQTSVMTDQTIADLKRAQDAWESLWNSIVVSTGNAIASIKNVVTSIENLQKAMRFGPGGMGFGILSVGEDERIKAVAKEMDQMARKGGAVAKAWGQVKGEISGTMMSAEDLDLVYKELDRTFQSTGKTIAANAAAAEKLDDAMKKAATIGAKAFKDFHTGITNVNRQMDLFVNTHLRELGARGLNVLMLTSDAAVKLGLDMAGLHPVVSGLSKEFLDLTTTGIKPIPPEVKKVKFELDDLSKALSQMATVAGGTFGAFASGFATIVSGANAAKTAIQQIKDASKTTDKLEGLLGMSTGIMGIVSAALAAVNAIKGIWGAINQREGRHAVEDFADSFGGFDALHAKLLELGDAGEALWVKLTQGTAAGNADAAARVIAEIEAALARQAEAVGEVTTATEEQAQATIETASQAAKALEELGPKIKTNEDEWRGWGDVVTAQIQRIADAVRALPLPGLPSAGAITEGSRDASGANITVVSMLDGRQIAKSTARYLPDALEGIA